MKEERKTKVQLIKELAELKRRVKKIETKEGKDSQTSAALKESEKRFRNIFESSKDGIIFFDEKNRKIILGNEAMAKLLGCSKKELVGRSIKSLHPPKEWPGIEKEFQKHVNGELLVSTGIPVVRKDGTIFYADISSSLITLEGKSFFSAFFRDITERQQTEKALIESREQYRSLASSEDSMYLVDRKCRFLFMNKAHLSRLGLSLKKVVGRSYGDLHSPEDTKRFRASIKKVLETKRSFQVEHHSERDQKYFLRTFSPVRDAQGSVTSVTVISKNITEHKRAEKDLEEREENFRNLAESANDGIMITLGDGTWTFANKRASEITGYSVPELLKKEIRDLVISDDVRKVIERYRKRMADKFVPSQYEISIRHKDGKIIPSEITAAKTVWQGRPANLIIFRDITERKQAEEAMRESEEKYRNLVERANDGIGIGQDGIIQFANTRLSDMIGYSIEEVVGKPVSDFFMRAEVPKDMNFYKRRMEGEDLPTIYETALRHKNGNRIEVELNGGLINYKGRPADLVIIRDIAERKRAEEALRESEARLKAQYQGSPIPTFTWQKKGKTFELVDFNPAAMKITQGEAQKYFRKTAAEMYQNRPEILQDLDRCFTEKEVIKRELQSRHFMPGRIMVATCAFVPPDLVIVYADDITERKRVEEALRESEEKFRNIFDNASIGMSMASLDGSVYINQAFSEMLGYTKEELSGLKWQDFTHPDDIELTQEYLEQLLSGEKTSVRFIKRYITKDGSTLWGDLNVVLQKDKDGKPLYYISGLLDISERKRWEALIERTISETRVRFEVSQALAGKETEDEVLDALIQQAGFYPQTYVAICTDDRQGEERDVIFRLANPFESGVATIVPIGTRFPSSRFKSLNRYSIDQPFTSDDIRNDERIDLASLEVIHKVDASSFAFFPLTAGKEWMGFIATLAKPIGYFDKEKQQLYQTLAEQGAVALRAARLREQVRESQKRFQGLVETLNDVIWEVDENWAYTYVGPKIRDMLGVEPEEVLGKTPFDFMPPEEAHRVSGLFETLKAARQPLIALENTCRHKEGHLVVFETSGLPFFDADGQFMGYRGVARDITERMQTQKALQISEERFRIAAENSNDFIYEWDLNTGQLEWFGAAIERLNHIFSEPPITTTAFEKSIHPEDYERISKAVRRQVRYGEPYREEYRLIGKTGDIFYIQTAGKCLRDEKGWAYKWIGTTSDITERKRAEEALRQAEEKYRAIVENAIEGIFQSTSGGKFLTVNAAVAKFHGYDSPEELISAVSDIGKQLYVHPEDRQRYLQLLADEGVVKGFETQFYTKDKKIKWGSMNVRTVQDDEGSNLYYEGTIEDITARKEAEEGLQKSLEKLRKALGGIIQAMSLTVESRDPYTAGHQRRVADLARAIAQEMGLPEEQVDALRMAGIVHDLGKISIPAEILSKPSELSDIEFSLIKAHPQISYDILKDIDFNWPVAEIVLQHHERINGSGYPNGLSGEAIYLEARILAVADVVEAISSHRPYRPAYGVDVALEEIEKNKEVLYDPKAVAACLRLFREKGFKFE